MHITEILLGKVRATLIEDTLRVISVMWHYYCAFGTICTTALGSDSGPLTWNRLLVGVILIFDEILNNTLQSMIAGVVTPRFALALGR